MILRLAFGTLRFIERNTRTAYRIEKLQREEIPEYPMAALREAITNAVMHRDWFFEGANVFVEIFSDRIEVSSPGGLPKGMLLADLGRKSVRRNPLIADLLHRIAFIEKAGTGIKRMRDGARDQGYPVPEFSVGNFFTALFRPLPKATPQATPQVVTLLEGARNGASRDSLQKVAGIKDRKHFIEAYLNPLVAAGWLALAIPVKPRSPKQRYCTTEAGFAALKNHEQGT